MRLSRDEAREIACTALLLTIGLRVVAGVLQLVEEIERDWTVRSALGRFLSPVGSTMGMLALGAALLIVLSPRGSIATTLATLTLRTAGAVMVLGAVSALNSLTSGFGSFAGRLEFTLRNGVAAAVLAGAGWWMLRNLDPDR